MPDTCKNFGGFVEEQHRPTLDLCFGETQRCHSADFPAPRDKTGDTAAACFFRDIPHSVFPLTSPPGLHATGAHNRL